MISLDNLTVSYGGWTLFDNISLLLNPKDRIGLVGKNGAGKTTLLRLIVGDISMNNLDSDEECGITMAGKQEIGFLRQVNFTEKDVTVEEEIKKVFEPVFSC